VGVNVRTGRPRAQLCGVSGGTHPKRVREKFKLSKRRNKVRFIQLARSACRYLQPIGKLGDREKNIFVVIVPQPSHTRHTRTMLAVAALLRAPIAARPNAVSSPRQRRRSVVANVGRSKVNELTGEPEWVEISDAAAAIEDAQEQYQGGDFAGAVKTLEGALKLGGSGTKRDRSKPAELSLGEKQAIFYNLSSAHSKLGDVDRGLEALEALLQAGYCSAQLYGFGKANEDYVRLMRDPDLETVRGDARFKQCVDKYQVTPTELQLQLDPSQSVIGRAMKMWGSKK
jgi:hypothetical protein